MTPWPQSQLAIVGEPPLLNHGSMSQQDKLNFKFLQFSKVQEKFLQCVLLPLDGAKLHTFANRAWQHHGCRKRLSLISHKGLLMFVLTSQLTVQCKLESLQLLAGLDGGRFWNTVLLQPDFRDPHCPGQLQSIQQQLLQVKEQFWVDRMVYPSVCHQSGAVSVLQGRFLDLRSNQWDQFCCWIHCLLHSWILGSGLQC